MAWTEQLQAVVNHGPERPAQDPSADQRAAGKQNKDCAHPELTLGVAASRRDASVLAASSIRPAERKVSPAYRRMDAGPGGELGVQNDPSSFPSEITAVKAIIRGPTSPTIMISR